jgi:hypothetical protein
MNKADIMKKFFVNTFDTTLKLKTLVGEEKVAAQSMEEIIESGVLEPNTMSFGQNKRLSFTELHDNYTETYRERGIIFQSDDHPDYILPFDMSVLAKIENEEVVVLYDDIEDKLHVYYNMNLIPGFEKFMFKDSDKMFEEIPSPEVAFEMINKFRVENGFDKLSEDKFKLFQYNEAVVTKPIKLTIVGLFGELEEIKKLAEKHHLPYFKSAKEFYEKAEQLRKQEKDNNKTEIRPPQTRNVK